MVSDALVKDLHLGNYYVILDLPNLATKCQRYTDFIGNSINKIAEDSKKSAAKEAAEINENYNKIGIPLMEADIKESIR